jgi:hypothetical protein
MSLTRKRQKELDRLRSDAQQLWGQQQEVLANANALAASARKQAAFYSREELAPRMSVRPRSRPRIRRDVTRASLAIAWWAT